MRYCRIYLSLAGLCCLIFFSRCDQSIKTFPDAYAGKWFDTIPIEGTEGMLEMELTLSGDSVIIKQTYPRMAGIDKTKTTYVADEIKKISANTIGVYFTDNNAPVQLSLELTPEKKLKASFCRMNDAENEDVEYASCTEWGEFGK